MDAVIVTRYWFTEGFPRIETIEWVPDPTGIIITVPEIAEVEDMLSPTEPVDWLTAVQVLFDLPLVHGTDPYTLAPMENAQLMTKAEWDAAVAVIQQESEDLKDTLRQRAEERLATRTEAITKLAESAGLTPEQVEVLVGGV